MDPAAEWNGWFVSMFGVGLAATFAGGCPLRQLILTGKGGTDNAANGAVYMYTYPRDIEITKVDENNVKVACTLGPTESFDTKIATYNDQFEVVNGIPSLKKLYVLPETTMSTANAEKTYGNEIY